MDYVCEGGVKDYSYYTTALELNIRLLKDGLRDVKLENARVEACCAMNNILQILNWIDDHEDE